MPAFQPTADQFRAFRDDPYDGPVAQVNLLKFRVKAEYAEGDPEHGEAISGEAAYQRYSEAFSVAAAEVGGLVAPPFTYGYKSQQKSGGGNFFPGTTSLDGASLVNALKDVIREFARHGNRQICIVNGHFENSWFIAEGIDLALRELGWSGIHDTKVVVLSYWDFVDQAAIAKLYPEGFLGWDIEHGGVLETSLMLRLYPDLVSLERAVDHAPASFPPYDVYPPHPDWTPASGTLSSPKNATAEKGDILLDVCTRGIVTALRTEFATRNRVAAE